MGAKVKGIKKAQEKAIQIMRKIVIVLLFVVGTSCDSKSSNTKGVRGISVTHDYLVEKGFKQNGSSSIEYWLRDTKCSEIQKMLGFSWRDLKYDEFMWGELWTVKIGGRLFTISTEKKGEKKGKNYLMKHPGEFCYATVTLPRSEE